MVDNLSEDSSPKITASEVTWTQDQNCPERLRVLCMGCQRIHHAGPGNDSPTYPCYQGHPVDQEKGGGGSGTHTIDEEESEDNIEPVVRHNLVKYSPSSEDTVRTAYNSKPSTSMAKLQDQLEHKIRIQSRDSRKFE